MLRIVSIPALPPVFLATLLVCPTLCGSLFAASASALKNRALADTFFTNGTATHLVLEISEDGLNSLRRQPREDVRATLREGDTLYPDVAVHLKGSAGSFRRLDDRPGFTLDFNHYHPDGRFHGLKKLHLNNSVQDPSRMSEMIGGELFRQAGVPASRAQHVILQLNDRKLGLYVALEAMDKDFLARHFDTSRGYLYGQSRKCDVTDRIERMEGDGPLEYAGLKAASDALNEDDPKRRMEKLEQAVDMERFLSFMAVETLLVHHDGYTCAQHNYRIHEHPETGRLTFLPHDLDQLVRRQEVGLMPPARGLVAQAVLRTPGLRSRYQQRVVQLATNLFDAAVLTNRIDALVARTLPVLREYDSDTAVNFINMASQLKTRLIAREIKVDRQLAVLSGAESLEFKNDIAKLTEWRPLPEGREARVERIKSPDGRSSLWIKASGPTAPSWRVQSLLEPGRYRLEGRVRCAGVEGVGRRRWEGAGLIVLGIRQRDVERVQGDTDWQDIAVEFEMTIRDDVEFGCELRALKGEAWFDADSLHIVRLR